MHVSAAIVHGLGFEVTYGDTDSVMYTIRSNVNSNGLVYSYVDYLNNSHVDIRSIEIMGFISGNKSAIPSSDVHLIPICGVVVKIYKVDIY